VAGSTFVCSLDKGPFRACESPFKKRLGLRKHTLLVQAISPFGPADTSPAKVKFRIAPRPD